MVMTADGAIAGPDGRSRTISGPADRAVLSATRAWADAILVGAGTLRTEAYNPIRARLGEQRLAAGRAISPRLVIITRSASLDWDDPVFDESAVPPLLVTAARGGPIPKAVEHIRFPGPDVDLAGLVGQLFGMGMSRLTCEGGPSLLADMITAGLIDEMDLTIAPHLGGHAATRAGVGPRDPGAPAVALTGLALAGLACRDDHIFARYVRRG
jgi:riboflavin biosynthesis pyrimidine reductase